MIRYPTGIGLLTALLLLAALSQPTYAASSPSIATHPWHNQRDTPSSSNITSPTASAATTSSTTSPSNSTASSLNSTSPALALATALLSLSPSNCTDSGGGCAVFSQYLQNATTDPEVCADDVILSAQVCALCSPTGGSVGVYNVFVRECDSEGLNNSTGTIGGGQGPATSSGYSSGSASSAGNSNSEGTVTPATATATGAATSVITSAGSTSLAGVTSASATNAASAASASASATSVAGTATSVGGSFSSTSVASSSSNTGVQANEQTSGSMTLTASLSGLASSTVGLQTAADFAEGGATGGTSGVLASSVPSVPIKTSSAALRAATGTGTSSNALLTAQTGLSSANLSASATLSSLAAQSSAAITTNTSALNASETFFALQVSSSCTSDCSTWQSLASSCTDDTCICTDSALTSAASCSSCVGAAGQSDALEYTIQMAAYSQYQGNCSEEATLDPSASGSSNAIEVVASAGTTYSSGLATNASATGTVAAQDAEQTVVVTSSAGRRVKQWVGKRPAGRAVLLGLLWIGVARW
ncbi:hypothetical protein JCM24511_04860 [Saitozyma sp. JCM 24511]|nr:hypothetical protein JCM24511_04860 [Saitozyma sp. JCM 24511]